jgi:cell division septum initiation protein DivIVA
MSTILDDNRHLKEENDDLRNTLKSLQDQIVSISEMRTVELNKVKKGQEEKEMIIRAHLEQMTKGNVEVKLGSKDEANVTMI